MRYQISGKQIDVGSALSEHVKTEIGTVLAKYSTRPTDAHVIFSRNAHQHVCESIVHLSTGLTVQAKAHDPEIYAAFDQCTEKMDKQLRRYKRRLKDHHKTRAEPVERTDATAYVLAATEEESEIETAGETQPVIIAEEVTRIPSLTVGEAVMQMELAHADHLVFRNLAHQAINIVYRRDDGNIGWVDPGGR